MRTNKATKDLQVGDILNGEKVTEVRKNGGSVTWKTKADGWMVQPVNPNFRVNVK